MAEKSIPHYPRPEYAKEIANGLLGTPSEGGGFNHGLFISGHRRTGKTFFLKLDLMPELHSRGAITVYVDLSSDGNDGRPTKEVIREALLQKKNELDREKKERMSAQLGHFSKIMLSLRQAMRRTIEPEGFQTKSMEITRTVNTGASVMGNEASVEATVTRHLERVNEVGVDNTIDGLVKDIITNHSSTLVLIIDEVQVSLSSKDGDSGMWALKSAMEHINYDDSVPGRFLCVNTGSHRGMVNLMATRRTDGLYDTPVENYKKLDRGYLQWFKSERQGKRNDQVWPSDDALEKGFAILGRRPLNLNTVMKSLEGYDGNDADRTFLALCHQNNLVTNTDEAERLLALGELCCRVYDRVCMSDMSKKVKIYSSEALNYYSEKTGRKIVEYQVQVALDKLVEENFVYRLGKQVDGTKSTQGHYNAVDELFVEYWMKKRGLQMPPEDAPSEEPVVEQSHDSLEAHGDPAIDSREHDANHRG